MSELNPAQEFGDSEARISNADALSDMVTKEAKASAVKQLGDAVRKVGKVNITPYGKTTPVRPSVSDPKRQLPPSPVPSYIPGKFVGRVEYLKLHTKKGRARFVEIVNGSSVSGFVRNISWGYFGRCYVFVEWSEEVKRDAEGSKQP